MGRRDQLDKFKAKQQNSNVNEVPLTVVVIDKQLKYLCQICEQKFKLKDQLKNHISDMHSIDSMDVTVENAYHCHICLKMFSDKCAYYCHMKESHKLYMCEICGECKFYSRNAMVKHQQAKHPQLNYCTICDKQFINLENYKMHQKRHQCIACGQEGKIEVIETHCMKEHNIILKSDGEIQCIICPYKNKNYDEFKAHSHNSEMKQQEKEPQQENKQQTCTEQISSAEEEIEAHTIPKIDELLRMNEWTCCGLTFTDRLQYNTHTKSEHRCKSCKLPMYSFDPKSENCRECEKKHKIQSKCDQPKCDEPNCDQPKIDQPKCLESQMKDEWKCELCARRMPSYEQLVIHSVKSHTLRCIICSMKFSTFNLYATHKIWHAMGNSQDIKTHTPLQCEICNELFTEMELLERHFKKHYQINIGNTYTPNVWNRFYKCVECQTDFWNEETFGKHYKKVHKLGKLPIPPAHPSQPLQKPVEIPKPPETGPLQLLFLNEKQQLIVLNPAVMPVLARSPEPTPIVSPVQAPEVVAPPPQPELAIDTAAEGNKQQEIPQSVPDPNMARLRLKPLSELLTPTTSNIQEPPQPPPTEEPKVDLTTKKKSPRLKCLTCEAVFRKMDNFVEHRDKHKCRTCDFATCRISLLGKHYKSVHNVFNQCIVCAVVFPNADALQEHKASVHHCSICLKFYVDLKKHRRVHACVYCNFSSCSEETLDQHYQHDHVVTMSCTPCKMTFYSPISYQKHKDDIHYCSKCQTYKVNLNIHKSFCKGQKTVDSQNHNNTSAETKIYPHVIQIDDSD